MSSTIANNMPNTIVVSEKRSVINDFRNWYKEKIIDTGVSQKFEEGLISYHRTQEKLVDVLGRTATIVLTAYPADGPLGEMIAMVAGPFVSKTITLQNRLTERNIITAKRKFEADFIRADGSSEKVVLPEINLNSVINETKDIMGMLSDFDAENSKGVTR